MSPISRTAIPRAAASLAALALLGAACGPAAQPQPTAAPPKPTSAPAAQPTTAPAASPVAAPAAKPTEAPKPATAASPAPAAAQPTTAPAAKPAAAASPAAAAKDGPRGGALRTATLGGLPRVLHPYVESQQFTTPWSDANVLNWASLISVDYNTLDYAADPRRDLAREMPRVSNNGRTFTFTLRDEIKWSDGRPITSADFMFAWENASKKENNWVAFSSTIERIESFKTPDPKTIEVTLKEPLARFLALGIAAGISPVPRHVWEGKPWLDPAGNPEVLKPTVVSGPFIPKEITAERHVHERNPNWWGKAPNLDQVVFLSASAQTSLELLKTRQVEWTQSYPPAQYEESKQIPHANIVEWSGATGSYRVIQFNMARPFLQDKRVREALVRVISREDLVQFEDNLAVPQLGFYPQGSRWRNDNVSTYDFDMARARQLLQEAGYTLQGGTLRDRAGQPVKMEILWPTTSQPRGKMATYWQQQLRQLGIEATVTGLEFNAFVDKYQRQKDFDAVMGSFSATLDPDSVKSQIETGGTQNATGFTNPRVDELLKQGAVEQDDAKRKQIYDEIQKIVIDELPQYYMLTLKNFTAFDRKVGGVSPLKGGDILRQNNLQVLDWSITQ